MIYILILNYNNATDTTECIGSILKNTNEKISIIIIDNSSTDNSSETIHNWLDFKNIDVNEVIYQSKIDVFQKQNQLESNITYLSVDSNNGYASGNNIGIKYVINHSSKEDYIWILNNDTIIQKNTLENLIKCYNNLDDKKIALLGAKILNEDLTLQSIGLPTSNSIEQIKERELLEVEHISGCSIFLRADKIKEIGFLPEEYFLYYEETDWMKSIRKKGFKIFTCLSSQLVHKHAKSTGGIYSPFVMYYMTRNQILFNRKYLSKSKYYVFLLKTIFRNSIKIIYYVFKNLESSKSIYMGTLDGILNKKGKKGYK